MRGMGRGEEGLTLSQERCSGNLSLRHVFVAVFFRYDRVHRSLAFHKFLTRSSHLDFSSLSL